MKSIIVYFSQTGNTEKVARAIQAGMQAVTGQCDIAKLEKADVKSLLQYELIGLGCPTFLHEEPLNVQRFIRTLGPLKGKYSFIFSTHGGHPSNVLPSMAGKLRRQGLKVLGGFNCDGSDHMPHFTSPWFTDGHPDQIDLEAATSFGRNMAELRQRISQGEKVPMARFQWLRDKSLVAHMKGSKVNKPRSRGFDFKMTLDRQKCRYPRCRLCIDNCPVNAIDLSAEPVIFREGCISCYFCDMVCPTGAIEIGTANLESQKMKRIESFYRRQYAEFFEKAKTELIGNRTTLFRLLVDKVQIGNIDTVYGERFKRRPRYVIRDRK